MPPHAVECTPKSICGVLHVIEQVEILEKHIDGMDEMLSSILYVFLGLGCRRGSMTVHRPGLTICLGPLLVMCG